MIVAHGDPSNGHTKTVGESGYTWQSSRKQHPTPFSRDASYVFVDFGPGVYAFVVTVTPREAQKPVALAGIFRYQPS